MEEITPCYIKHTIFRYSKNIRTGYVYEIGKDGEIQPICYVTKDIYDEKGKLINHIYL